MKMKIKTVIILGAISFALALTYFLYTGTTEYQNNPLLSKYNIDQAYQIYFTGNPLINERLYEGKKDAPITIIAILDTTAQSSRQFYENTISKIRAEYVQSGQVKIYYKYYITDEDISLKTNRYTKTKDIYCYRKAEGEDIKKIHQKIIIENNTKTIDTNDLDINYEKFRTCINGLTPKQIIEDMVESTQYKIQAPSLIIGISGRENTVLYGEPTNQTLRTIIRNQQIKVGI